MSMDKQKVDNYVDELIDVINQKQTEIDELVGFIKEVYTRLGTIQKTNANELIQKHTKK